MIVLAYGSKLPETDDDGSVFFAALEYNISRLDAHSHNGTDSPALVTASQAIASGSWGALYADGLYRQLITITGGLLFANVAIQMRLSNGTLVYPQIERASTTTYYVYSNDNTIDLVAYYSS